MLPSMEGAYLWKIKAMAWPGVHRWLLRVGLQLRNKNQLAMIIEIIEADNYPTVASERTRTIHFA